MDGIRRAALSASRSARSAIGGVLLVLALASGLIAMHDAGVAHAHHADRSAEPAVAASATSSGLHGAHPSGGEHGGDPDHGMQGDREAHPAPQSDRPAADSARSNGSDDAGSTSPDCSLAGAGCAMAAATPVAVGLTVAPEAHSTSAAVVAEEPRGIRLGFVALPPPDLHFLSISRT
jgi:hypothetical protein